MPTTFAIMAQNVYDDERFFDEYSELPRSTLGLDGAPEWPALRALLPDLHDRRVLDLGCGFGWFCRWAQDAGATWVIGIDLSERMLDRARADTDDERIMYEQHDLDQVQLPASAFDLVHSALTLHYLADLERLYSVVYSSLEQGGSFVFSVEHPIFTAPTSPDFVAHPSDDGVVWPLDSYLAEGERTTDWLTPGVVKQHRTITTYVDGLLSAGFELSGLVEWGPSSEQIDAEPSWAVELDRPPFMLVSATRR